ncbi:hypothetical protein AX14_005059 [Amanita brunnescens Koide BX004]|nr:hypothetical protein AX14_005059 [Amanita brunnescens Koide BX004]
MKISVEIGRKWQASANAFNTTSLKSLKNLIAIVGPTASLAILGLNIKGNMVKPAKLQSPIFYSPYQSAKPHFPLTNRNNWGVIGIGVSLPFPSPPIRSHSSDYPGTSAITYLYVNLAATCIPADSSLTTFQCQPDAEGVTILGRLRYRLCIRSATETRHEAIIFAIFPLLSPLAMTIDQSMRDERVPLLHAERAREIHQTPFPWHQFSILFALQTAVFLTLLITYPFIPDLIRNSGIAKGEKDVGHYVGFLISTTYVAETTTTFHFCRISDYLGRKPVFLASIIGLSICICGFGLSKTFWALVLCQALIGALNGTYGLTRSILVEMTDSTNIARAMAYIDISWYVAGAIGSNIGGSLSRPVEQFPQLFGSSIFLKEYPYFLPCVICSIFLFTAWLVGTIFLRETVTELLPLSRLFKTRTDGGVIEEGGTRRSLLLRTGVFVAAINLATISLVEKFFGGTEALFLSTPIKDGGLGLTPRAIGTFSSVSAIVIGASQLFIFPRMHKEWGSKCVFVLGAFATIPRFALWPLINWIARRDGYTHLIWLSLGFQVCCSVLAQFACLAIWVLITQLPGSRASLSSVLGFCQMVASILRALGPAISNSLFSLSIEKGCLGGYLAYFVFVCSAVIALCAALLLPSDNR